MHCNSILYWRMMEKPSCSRNLSKYVSNSNSIANKLVTLMVLYITLGGASNRFPRCIYTSASSAIDPRTRPMLSIFRAEPSPLVPLKGAGPTLFAVALCGSSSRRLWRQDADCSDVNCSSSWRQCVLLPWKPGRFLLVNGKLSASGSRHWHCRFA